MNFPEALRLLERRQETRWKLGLTRIEGLLRALGDPHAGLPAVHVAGTNGKGSFCAILAAALRAAGLRTGLYTSPHLISPLERIQIDGRPIPPAEFGRLIGEAARAEPEEATYFELVTAAAFLHFRDRRVEAAVIETGLGGRLDATNALREPLLTVITSIDIDHVKQLGETRAQIAGEKAGILKPGVPCLCGETDPEALAVLTECARLAGAPLEARDPSWASLGERWQDGVQELEIGGQKRRLRLLGAAAARNAALVAEAAGLLLQRGLCIPERALSRGMAEVDWPGRFQVLHPAPGRSLILDGAHNPAALRAFADTWSRSPWRGAEPTFLVGALEDKDFAVLARTLAPLAAKVIATRPDSPRALDPERLARLFRSAGCRDVEADQDPGRALLRWKNSPAAVGVVCGSFYLVGRVLRELEGVAA